MLRHNVITGLDLGTQNIKLVVLKRSWARWYLQGVILEKIPLEIAFNEESRAAFIKEFIVNALKNDPSLKTGKLFIAIPRNVAIFKYLFLPSLDQDEISHMLPFEIEKLIPLALDQVHLDYQVLDTKEQGEDHLSEILAVVVKKDIIDRQMQFFCELGWEPDCINLSAVALYNAFVQKYPADKSTLALLDIGSQSTEINILVNGLLKFSRSAPVGGLTLDHMLQDELNLSLTEIEQLKFNGQLFEKNDLRVIGEEWGRLLRTEISHTFETFHAERQQEKVEKVLLSGGGSRLAGLAEYLGRKLSLPVEYFDPFPLPGVNTIKSDGIPGYYFPVAAGLTSQGSGQAKLDLSLLPKKFTLAKKQQQRKKILLSAALGAVLTLLVFGLKGYSNMEKKQLEAAALDRELAAIKPDVTVARELQAKIQLLQERSQGAEFFLDALRQLSLLAPANVYIEHLVFARQGQVNLRGKTEHYAPVATLVMAMEKSPYFQNVVNKGSRENKLGNIKLVEFEIECSVRNP
ncbi:MAG: type IV pilus assembly protein PilM [bacterium]|nr:type IV pilus assembly protein PilM [bacterium]MDD5353601.1 type IV pilus assembly protein PilM [bacterium]MDD5755863.1 type IV pilus assembly protein PilM [bacterium]